jgi:hypothetical protein
MPPSTDPARLSRPAPSRRRSIVLARRRRAAVLGALVLALVLVAVIVGTGSGTPHKVATRPRPATPRVAAIPAVEAGLLPWTLDAPLSREVVLPASGSSVTVAGGLSASNGSLARVFSLDTATGQITEDGALPAGVHDAAGARVGALDLVVGGGSPTTVATGEQFVAPTPGTAVTAGPSGVLPQPRSDASAVTIGGTAYVVGGYDGTNPDAQVLSTRDGLHYSVVAALPVPVRYPALGVVGHTIYVLGGEAVGGPGGGSPVDTVQAVDVSARTAKQVGHLAGPLMGAAAAVMGGHIYLAGGVAAPAGAAGTAGPPATAGVWAYDIAAGKALRAGTLPAPVAYGGVQVVGQRAWIVGGEDNGVPVSSVEMFTPNAAFGSAGSVGAGSPYFGARLLVADRGNNRLLLLDNTSQVVWSYPSAYAAAPPGGFYFPDDAFFAHNGTEIISNQEDNQTIVIIAFPSGQVLWQYGHPLVPGTGQNYLHTPDDAYLLKNGQITVADANNCRVLFINPDKTVAKQIGTNGVCRHHPPDEVGSPNGDTPLANGDVLVSEINGQWVSEYTPGGQLVWSVHLPVGYPSDAQQIGPDRYLISDYSHPGAIVEFNHSGQVSYKYSPPSGPGELNQPSLTELLPSGVFLTNDDYRDRMVAIDPTTQALVWQYGVTDTPGTAPGMLNTPDGFDLLLPTGTTPTHTATG